VIRPWAVWAGAALLALGCAHATPTVAQVFVQVTRTFDPEAGRWEPRLTVFAQGVNADGSRQFDRLHLIQDRQNLWVPLSAENWTTVERPGEYWVGTNGLRFPEGTTPAGDWRIELVTKAGLKADALATVPPTPPDAPAPRTEPVSLTAEGPLRYRVSGWVDDYLVWSRDAAGALIGRSKTVGPSFSVPSGAVSFELYSYDRARGEGLAAGPFSVKDPAAPADR